MIDTLISNDRTGNKRNNLFFYLTKIGKEIADEQNLPLNKFLLITEKGKYAGLCHANGIIEIYISCSKIMLDRVKIQEGMRTVCHELAHLKHFNHGPEFWAYQKVLCEIATQKIGIFIPYEKSVRS